MAELTFKEVWDTLSKIDVSEHTKEKYGGLTYLSWTWAWSVMMEKYPECTYELSRAEEAPVGSGTWMVSCSVKIRNLERQMWLPVMDNRSNAKDQPNSRDVNDTNMRCLVKCFAMFGLGHYIYAGEDLPKDVNISEAPSKAASTKGTAVKVGTRPAARKVKDADTKESRDAEPKPDLKLSGDVVDEPAATEEHDNPTYIALKVFVEGASSKASLKKIWDENKEALIKLKDDHADMYDDIQSAFLEKRNELNG